MNFASSRRRLIASLAATPLSVRLLWPHVAVADTVDERLTAAIASPTRTASNVARDRYRHPAEVLTFFGLTDTDSVLEIEPGAGYWTEILAPYLKGHGTYRVAIPEAPAGEKREVAAQAAYLAKLKANPTEYADVIVTGFSDSALLAPENSMDLILSFRNLHDWMADGTATKKLAAIRAALKPGGTFGIEDHRGPTSEPQEPTSKKWLCARGLRHCTH